MKKESILQEDVTIINVYAQSIYIKICKEKSIKQQGEKDEPTISVGDFNREAVRNGCRKSVRT